MVMLQSMFLLVLRIHLEVSTLKAPVHFKDIADGHKLDLQSGHQWVLSGHLQLFVLPYLLDSFLLNELMTITISRSKVHLLLSRLLSR